MGPERTSEDAILRSFGALQDYWYLPGAMSGVSRLRSLGMHSRCTVCELLPHQLAHLLEACELGLSAGNLAQARAWLVIAERQP